MYCHVFMNHSVFCSLTMHSLAQYPVLMLFSYSVYGCYSY